MGLPVPPLTESGTVLCVLFLLTVPFAAMAIALMNTGLGRSRSAAHSMLAALCTIGVAALVYLVIGFAWQGTAGGPAYSFAAKGHTWNWLAGERFFLRGVALDGSAASLIVWLQIMSVGIAALIPLGSGIDRWRLGASCASAALLAGITYPVFAHWVWGGGWLAQIGLRDAGGSSVIHATGGLTALAIAWILGPRRGKYASGGMPAAMPGHNAVLVLLACLLASVGWTGLNCAGAILFAGLPPARMVLPAINTLLSGGVAGLAAGMITALRFGRPDASLCANGWVGGLVAGSASCAFVPPPIAMLIALAAGALVVFSVEWFDLHLGVDDPGGAISAHGMAGLWGTLALGIFTGQWLPQFVGVATLIGFVLPLSYGLNWLLNRFHAQRVVPEGERQGLDLYELGAGAYPEFVTHRDDFSRP